MREIAIASRAAIAAGRIRSLEEGPSCGPNSAQSYYLIAQKHTVLGCLKRLMAFSTFIIARNPIGTLIAILQTEQRYERRVMRRPVIMYE
jgi:hypothetical protein